MSIFNYSQAFCRNLGWVTQEELEKLKKSTVAIAGLGGVGGVHLITLVRTGIESFHLAEIDQFELSNFNRQYGASLSTIGKNKLDVMIQQALDINPELKIKKFDQGVTEQNLDGFLQGVDLYLDGLDIFSLNIREKIFSKCHQDGIPGITVGPFGFGTSSMIFLPGQMSFDEYFNLNGLPLERKVLKFILGMTPSLIQVKALVDKSYFDLINKKTPSTPAGCQLAAGVATTEVVKVLLNRGDVKAAPWSCHFDSYSMKLKKKYTWLGLRNPWQKIKFYVAQKIYGL